MPIYEYQCTKCGEVFEVFQKITDQPITQCKFCQARVEKLISQSSFQLKGTGWYLTDYARKNSNHSPNKASESSDEKGRKDSKSSEKNPESKT